MQYYKECNVDVIVKTSSPADKFLYNISWFGADYKLGFSTHIIKEHKMMIKLIWGMNCVTGHPYNLMTAIAPGWIIRFVRNNNLFT